MGARDPRTGQFIPAGADRTVDAAYEDFDVQEVSARADLDVFSGTQLFEDWHTTEPLGGLQRDELAELVTLLVRVVWQPHGGANENALGSVRGELSFDATSHLIELDESQETVDVDGVTSVDRNVWEQEQEPDILNRWSVAGYEVDDETNGSGYASTDAYDAFISYRPWYGRGPVVDRHTNLHYHLWLQISGAGDQGNLWWDTTMVWDVFARGQG